MPDKYDIDERGVREFVEMIGLPFTVLAIDSRSGSKPVARTCKTADEVVAFARARNKDRLNIYWLVNVASVQDKKPAKADMNSARFLWADCDPDVRKYGSYETAREYLLTEHAPKLIAEGASFMTDSGNGLQAFLQLVAPSSLAEGYTEYEKLNERLGEALGGPGTFNCDRIMRLPGTLNWPNEAKLNKGYPKEPSLSRLLFSDRDRNYSLLEIRMLLNKLEGDKTSTVKTSKPPAGKPRAAPASVADEHQRFESLLKTDTKLRSRWDGSTDFLRDTSGSGMDISLYALLVSRDFEDDVIIEIMEPWEHGSEIGRAQGARYWNRLRDNTKAKPSALTPVDRAIPELSKRYALVTIGGSAFVIDEASSPINLLKPDTFRLVLANRTVDVQTPSGVKKMPLADAWLRHPDRRFYERIEFAPGRSTRKGSYNLFEGWTVAPYKSMTVEQAEAGCSLLLAHIKNNVCQGDAEQYNYLIRWYAHLFQKPDEKPGVLVAVRGAKGVGKTKVAEAISALLGQHAMTVSQTQQLTGNFNAHLALALYAVLEEAVWAGDKKAESTLKHLITGSTMMLERKGVDAIEVPSFVRLQLLSNEEHVFPASADERRLFALECGNAHQNDRDYFKAIDDQLYGPGLRGHRPGQESPGLRALLTLLLKLDITNFNVRQAPETDALKAQRAASLAPHEEFLKECLEERSLADGEEWTDEETLVLKKRLYERYLRYLEKRRGRFPVPSAQFGKTIRAVFGWLENKPHRGGREWVVSGWSEASRAFEAAMKVRIDA